MEEMLKIILEQVQKGFAETNKRITGVEDRMTGLEDRMTEFEDRMTGLEDRMTGLKDRMTGLEGRLTKLETKVENEIDVKIQACFDNTEILKVKVDVLSTEVEDLKEKVIDHGIKIQIIDSKRNAEI